MILYSKIKTKDIIIDEKPRLIDSAYLYATFDEGKETLEKNGYHIPFLEELVKLRIQAGINLGISNDTNWVIEGALYVHNKGCFLTKNSPIMTNAKKATDCHRRSIDFYLTNEQVEQSLQGAVKLTFKNIPTYRFAEDEITTYAFGKHAQEYGHFLRGEGIKEMTVFLTNLQEKSFIRQVLLLALMHRSELNGINTNLNIEGSVRGIKNSSKATQSY